VVLLCIGIALGLALGLRVGVWYTLRKLGKYDYRTRRYNIKNTPWGGPG
jgi:hypothetical protein